MTYLFLLAVLKIIAIDVLLSGDNALVIAMACRTLPAQQRILGMVFGAGSAVAMRIAFTGAIAWMMELPYLRIVGAILLCVVAIKMLVPAADDDGQVQGAVSLWSAIVTVVVADATMSLDNVIAVAAAAHGDLVLLALGLALSIPIVVTGATAIMKLLESFPALAWGGGAILGWIAGETLVSDVALTSRVYLTPVEVYMYAGAGAAFVVLMGAFLTYGPSLRKAH